MTTTQDHNEINSNMANKETGLHHNTAATDHANGAGVGGGRKPYDYGGNPLAHAGTGDSARLPAFGGEFQPGSYAQSHRKFANPAPLGLCGFALTTFILSLVNMQARNVTEPNIVVASAYAYGGLIQLLAGMWEMAVGNTFGATALSSYGGFWIAFAITLTPGGFEIVSSLTASDGSEAAFLNSFAFFLIAWWIFTTLLLVCTLRSTLAFFLLFFFLDLAFLMLAIGYFRTSGGKPNEKLIKAGGLFGILAALMAWYNALAGLLDSTNSFFLVPVLHFPWSDKGRAMRTGKSDRATV